MSASLTIKTGNCVSRGSIVELVSVHSRGHVFVDLSVAPTGKRVLQCKHVTAYSSISVRELVFFFHVLLIFRVDYAHHV